MSIFIVDVEADGGCPGLYSMVSFAAIKVQKDLKNAPRFKALTAPISEHFIEEALKSCNTTRKQHLTYPKHSIAMTEFAKFIRDNSGGNRPTFLSDNPCFDWQWMNYYFPLNGINNPFGFSGRRIGDFYAGLERNWQASTRWKRLRETKHTHDPLDDVIGNAEAFIKICEKHRIRIPE